MLCDNCKEREVEIHLTKVENDTKVTLHLCKQCAQQKGFETGDSILKSPLGGFIQAMGKGGASLLPTPADGLRCSACGATLRDFRESGRLAAPSATSRSRLTCAICCAASTARAS